MDGSKPKVLPWLLLLFAILGVGAIICTFTAFAGAGTFLWNAIRKTSAPESALSTAEPGSISRPADPRQAQIQFTEGIVEVLDANGDWMPAGKGQLIDSGNSLRTGALSRAALAFTGSSQVILGPQTEIAIWEMNYSGGSQSIVLEQKTGASSHQVDASKGGKISYTISTPNGSLLAQGTRFAVSVEKDQGTRVAVEDGSVSVQGGGKTVQVNAGEVSTIYTGEPPSTPAMRISGEGAISQMGDSWVIAGQPFSIHEGTRIIGEPHVGDMVHVEGRLLADNTRLADLIYLLQSSPSNHFMLTGQVQEIGDEAWEIAGQTVLITGTTTIEAGIKAGDTARVEGVILQSGGLQATRISLYDPQEGLPFEFTGVVEDTGSVWTISGIKIGINKDTVIAEGVGEGDVVLVRGRILPDGSWIAEEILPAREGVHTFDISGRLESLDPWRVAGIPFETRQWTEIQTGLKAGDTVHVEGVIQEDGAWVAYEISKIEDTPYPLMVIIGRVISIDPWVISGIPLNVTDETIIEGNIVPGTLVRAEIYLLPDGAWQVRRISSLEAFAGVPGCMDVAATVVGVEGNVLRLLGWLKLEMDEDIRVEGDLRPSSIVLVRLCFDEEGHLTVAFISLVYQPEEGDENGEPPNIGDKVTICHKPLKKKGGNTITVARPALPAHLGHGDYIGACSR